MPGEEIDLESVDVDSELAKQQIYDELKAWEARKRIEDETEQIVQICFKNSPHLKKVYDESDQTEKDILKSAMLIAICSTVIYYGIQ